MDYAEVFGHLADVENRRGASFTDVEMKDGGNVFLFDGYAAVYSQPSDLGQFTEEIAPGAFQGVLGGGGNVPMLHEHHPHQLLATTRSGRLKLADDAHGLRVKAKLVKTDLSARVKALVDSGDITGMSYGFVAGRGNQKLSHTGPKPHRLLTGFRKLLDVSTTWDPAFPTTEASFRSKAYELLADSPESLQLLLLGAYPQREAMGDDTGGTPDEDGEDRSAVDETIEVAHPGADEQLRRLATAKRRIQFIQLQERGYDDAS